jgi:hypothetical protein
MSAIKRNLPVNAKQILEEQVIHVKRGRLSGLGFEPAFNAYYDFYLDSKYFERPLLELEDVTFFLYLRKNLNDRNPQWKMPTIRQMKKKFRISQDKIEAMMRRLDRAHLLKKESGYRKGEDGMNVRNDYILSDPIQTLDEFLTVAQEGGFLISLREEWCTAESCTENRYTDVPPNGTAPEPESGTDQQTLKTKHTSARTVDPRWQIVLNDLQLSLATKTFERFLDGTDLIEITNQTAVIGTSQAYARDWIENRLSDRIRRLLGVDAVKCVVQAESMS